jgi:NDP-sugar pyrophosphorylase family protein
VTAFVILAAGPGTRMGRPGDTLHKALVPLGSQAVISRQIGLAPPGARVIVCTGSRAQQVRGYLELAHPDLPVTFVNVPDWDQPENGPGASLLAARDAINGDDLVFTACDTLWRADESLWKADASWSAVAPVPAGTPLARWCRIGVFDGDRAWGILDKIPDYAGAGDAYTGLSMILRGDLGVFWAGIENSGLSGGEKRDVAGLAALTMNGALAVRRITWTDTGDEAAYQRAVAAWSGYDWSKPDEVTYVLPEQGRVVKFRADQGSVTRRVQRQATIAAAVPVLTGTRPGLFAYEYVSGVTGYTAAESDPELVPRLLDWAQANLWRPVSFADDLTRTCDLFYRVKTTARTGQLRPGLQPAAWDAASHVDWDKLVRGCVPVTFHGDFNLGNVIVMPDGGFRGIDWREDFGGNTTWGDLRYDLGKLAAGLIVHWENAQRGDFRPWEAGKQHLARLADWLGGTIPHDVMLIAALSLLNCAPLHAAPLDEILVVRAIALLEELA